MNEHNANSFGTGKKGAEQNGATSSSAWNDTGQQQNYDAWGNPVIDFNRVWEQNAGGNPYPSTQYPGGNLYPNMQNGYPTAPPAYNGYSYAQKSKIAAGLFGIFLGSLGIHKFYLGYTIPGIILLLVTVLTFGLAGFVTCIIGIVEGIIYLTMSDADFYNVHVVGKKEWF